ncbi:SWIM zinc finger family protein [Paenibacillus dakarensis]|uniref:SWIM zinc finger family protein n=1 Tax=Paenibacillus dakarensis TaxID=1527293 RepID=UPI0006D5561F|nr:SWIM zinc finger family protein [Paenibacillus dakarensis]
MNLIQPLDDTEWQTLIHNTAAYFSDLTIKRGFQYYKQGKVGPLHMPNDDHIEAIVQGTDDYKVDLVPGTLDDSRCTCPVRHKCKHMVAVLLEAASKQGRSVHALVNAHTTYLIRHEETSSTESGAASGSNGSAGAGAASGNPSGPYQAIREQARHLQDMPVSSWHQLFGQCVSTLGIRTLNSLYSHNALEAILSIKPSLTGVMDTLFELHARLFVLDKLVKQPPNQGIGSGLFIGYHVQIAADDIEKDINQRFASGELSIPGESVYSPRVSETLSYLRGKMLTESRYHPFFSNIYNQLWTFGIHPLEGDTRLYTEELEHLQSAETELGNAYSKAAGMLAQSLMHFYLLQDDKAFELLRAADKALYIQPEQLMFFLNMLSHAEDWTRLSKWLTETGPLLASYRNHNLKSYMAYWDQVVQEQPEAEQHLWNTLVDMLPYSKDIYQETLLAHGKWQEWMDYQLSTGREPLEFRVSVLQPIEKNAPELLLPFFHQAVERYILQKNRSSYKSAVKLLKRLAKLYKKLKQEERWENFITAFSERHSRLRALQEELRRGKLIS